MNTNKNNKNGKLELSYKENSDFNSDDYYLFEDWKLFISKAHKYNGNWYTNESLNFKCTSVKSIKCDELMGRRVRLKGTEIEGTVTKLLKPLDLGVNWDQGHKKFLPYFWNNVNTLEFL